MYLHSPDGNHDSAISILDLTSDEEEADTRIVLRCLYATHTIITWTLWCALRILASFFCFSVTLSRYITNCLWILKLTVEVDTC